MAHWIEDPQGRLEVEKVTKEMKLPVWKANHKGKFRDFWNELWDKIEDYVVKLKGDTEKNSKGLNDRLVSAVGKHDGDFPISNAVVGNVYYSELTKKYYKCKIGGPAPMPNGNFIDLSILENLNRLENLYKIEYKTDYDVLTILNRKFVVGSLETKGSTASKTLTANGFSFKNSIVMATAKKDNCSVAVIHSGDNLEFSTLEATSGNTQNGICKVDFFILLRN